MASICVISTPLIRHWVCAPTQDGNGREIASFGATTPELLRLAEWLKARQVESVAMESTGVYWIAPHEVLEAQGLQVWLVDTRQLARVPGRDKKTDPSDCQWIQRLHSCGLLRGSFRPEEAVCMLRTLVRDKANLVAESGDWLRRMQKSLDQMNVRVHRAESDIDGVTGMAILRAIAAGERDAQKLAKLRDRRCSKTEQQIAEQLTGHWREDHLFSLQQALKMYDAVQERIAAYEQEILRQLGEMEEPGQRGQTAPPLSNANKAKAIKTRGQEPKRQALYRSLPRSTPATLRRMTGRPSSRLRLLSPVSRSFLSGHREGLLTVHLPPKAGFLRINLTNRRTGAAVPSMRVIVMRSTTPPALVSSSSGSSTQPILLPPDKDLLLHVVAEGFQEWHESVGGGKAVRLTSGEKLTLDVQLEPSN